MKYVHSFPRETKDDHIRERSCPCHPKEVAFGDDTVVVMHREPPDVERRRFKEMFGDRRA